jgi:hypothetical protein
MNHCSRRRPARFAVAAALLLAPAAGVPARGSPADSPAALLDAARAAVEAGQVRKTDLAGAGNAPFSETPPGGALLVGFDVSLGRAPMNTEAVYGLKPLYLTDRGVIVTQGYGPFPDGGAAAREFRSRLTRVLRVKARPGYSVGAVTLCTGSAGVSGFSLTYLRIAGDKLDPDDSYAGEWVGGRAGTQTVVGTAGAPAVGVFGHAGDQPVTALGLIVAEPVTRAAALVGGGAEGLPPAVAIGALAAPILLVGLVVLWRKKSGSGSDAPDPPERPAALSRAPSTRDSESEHRLGASRASVLNGRAGASAGTVSGRRHAFRAVRRGFWGGSDLYRVYVFDQDLAFIKLGRPVQPRQVNNGQVAAVAMGGLLGGLLYAAATSGRSSSDQQDTTLDRRQAILDGAVEEDLRRYAAEERGCFLAQFGDLRDLVIEAPGWGSGLDANQTPVLLRFRHARRGKMTFAPSSVEDAVAVYEELPRVYGDAVMRKVTWDPISVRFTRCG